MTQSERAKQFMELWQDRETRSITKGAEIKVRYYKAYHEIELQGKVTNIDVVYRYLVIGEERIYFDDLYKLTILN